MHEAVAAEGPESLPEERLAQLLALLRRTLAEHQQQAPAAIPARRLGGVDVAGGGFETAAPDRGQAVIGAPADALGVQPFVADQAEDRGAHLALVEAARPQQADQAAEPEAAAVRQDGIAEGGDDQRTGAQRTLPAEILQVGRGGSAQAGLDGGKAGMLATRPAPEQGSP